MAMKIEDRRSPQDGAPNCELNPDDSRCGAQAELPTTRVVAAPTMTVYTTDAASPTQQTLADGIGAVTVSTVITNDDGSSYTRVSTFIPTSASTTTRAPTVVTDPPEAHGATAVEAGNNSGLTKGAIAGLAIGTCIAGAVIAFFAAWFIFKRRDRKLMQKTCLSGYPIYDDSSPELVMVQKSAAAGSPYVSVSQTQMRTPVPIPARTPAASGDPLAGVVPACASDQEVQNRIAALFTHLHRHIDTFYRDVHASITPSMDDDFAAFGHDVDMRALLQNTSQPTVPLKHALVAYALRLTDPPGGPANDYQSLWPAALANALAVHTPCTSPFPDVLPHHNIHGH